MVIVRRVVGESMMPTFRSGQLVFASRLFRRLRPGNIVVVEHGGLEKVKRISQVDDGMLVLLGDNRSASTDSRSFGPVPTSAVVGKVVWPISL